MGINKKGNIYAVVMVALIVFMIGMIMINFLKPEITSARTALSCSSSTITDGTKMLCLTVDIVLPYFILLVLSLAAGVITDKLLI